MLEKVETTGTIQAEEETAEWYPRVSYCRQNFLGRAVILVLYLH